MKKIKIILSAILTAGIILSLTACGDGGGSNETTPTTTTGNGTTSENTTDRTEETTPETGGNDILSKSAEEIIEYLYANTEKTEFLETRSEYADMTPVTNETCSWFLGKEGIPFEDATASESGISPSDYSLVIAKIKDGEDYAAVQSAINDNIDPMKWVCMGAEEKGVERIGNVIMVVLADKATVDALKTTFLTLA